MKVKFWWLFLTAALIVSGFLAINGGDETTKHAGSVYFFMVLAVAVAWLLALRLKLFGRK